MRQPHLEHSGYYIREIQAPEHPIVLSGGDLSAEMLLEAYQKGFFPWPEKEDELNWWFTVPRMILKPDQFIRSKSLRQSLRNKGFRVTFDRAFTEVIEACANTPRKGEPGTWIFKAIRDSYIRLHRLGYAHSVETWHKGRLVGGLYGVSLGKAFFGESMFYIERDASKVALSHLIDRLLEWRFFMIDCQMYTGHLARMGARLISGREYLDLLHSSLNFPTLRGKW
ncbi:MAG: leucyl/phenylalanyl-tRNA--protein transferase [Bacteroidales bacterium]